MSRLVIEVGQRSRDLVVRWDGDVVSNVLTLDFVYDGVTATAERQIAIRLRPAKAPEQKSAQRAVIESMQSSGIDANWMG